MIAYLSGTVLSKQPRNLVLDVHGVGYLVYVPRGLLEKTTEGQPLTLHIHTNVREDDLSLFGFSTQDEWNFFKLLLTVSGIGPKSALEILNAPYAKVRNAIAQKDVAHLTQIPGIGKKTAERIIVDLQGKIKVELMVGETAAPLSSSELHEREDLVHALVSLGYHRQQVVQGLKKIPQELSGDEAIIKYFLQNI